MCVIIVAWNAAPGVPLLVAANRDERHVRPTAAAAFGPHPRDVLAGRDLQAGGTWLGVDRRGRFAALSNLHPGAAAPDAPRSRGTIPLEFLGGDDGPASFLARLAAERGAYGPFNLFAFDPDDGLGLLDSERGSPEPRGEGIHVIANERPDRASARATVLADRVRHLLDAGAPVDFDAVFALLRDREPLASGDASDRERLLSAPFILAPEFGTRSSTVFCVGADRRARFAERSYDRRGSVIEERWFGFRVAGGEGP